MDQAEYQRIVKDFQHLKTSNRRAAGVVAYVGAITATALALSTSANGWVWLGGQVLLGFAIMQWFVLLHDCGHRHFFSVPFLNNLVGTVASFFAVLPFFPWRSIHSKHHVWTGWHDIDPTILATIPRELPMAQRLVVDFCWRFWVPLFTLAFGLQNFWNLPRLKGYFPKRSERLEHAFSVFVLIGAYAFLGYWMGWEALRLFGLGYLVFLVLSDPLLLSQHSHLPMELSHGEKVTPHKLWEQDAYTRSIVFPRWISKYVLLHFDVHITHHLLPTTPCYHLGVLHENLHTVNQMDAWKWLRIAKRTPGHQLLFQNRAMTGIEM